MDILIVGIIIGIVIGLQAYFGERRIRKIKEQHIESLKKDVDFWQKLHEYDQKES